MALVPVPGAVNDQSVEPGAKRRLVAKLRKAVGQFDKGLLCYILGVLAVAAVLECESKHRCVVRFYKAPGGRAVTLLGAPDQALIVTIHKELQEHRKSDIYRGPGETLLVVNPEST